MTEKLLLRRHGSSHLLFSSGSALGLDQPADQYSKVRVKARANDWAASSAENCQPDEPSEEEENLDWPTTLACFSASWSSTAAFSTLTFLGGLIAGHWLSLGRDKRKEFNALTAEALDGLHKQLTAIEAGRPGQGVELQWRQIEPHISLLRRRRFRRRVSDYKKAREESKGDYNGRTGVATYDPAAMQACTVAIRALLPFLKPR